MSKLAGKVAIVTGGSKGIGAAIARQLAAAGASVVVNYSSSKAGGDRVVAEIEKAGGKAIAVGANVCQEGGDRPPLRTRPRRRSAGSISWSTTRGSMSFAPLEAITEESFHAQFNLNVLGLILATQKAAEAFRSRRGQRDQHQLGRRRLSGRRRLGLQRHQRTFRRSTVTKDAFQGVGPEEDPRQLVNPDRPELKPL